MDSRIEHGFDCKIVADEFAKYWRLIAENPQPEISFAIDPGISRTGCDAYSVKEKDGTLFFSASNARSLFYAVYDFFGRKGCFWFWDGDKLPQKGFVSTDGTDFSEESRFEYRGIRYFAHRGLKRFQCEHWGIADWKRELDWCLKSRLNVVMLRIGMDDTWQKAFPDIVPYPDPSNPLPEALGGYDNRSLFWSLEDRGRLRKELTEYARRRGLEVPTDFGTVTHWYSRTPKSYLESVSPPLLPQATKTYGEETGRVFDIRDPKWYEEYWKLTEAQISAGYGGDRLLHTIGFGERRIFADRVENHRFKIEVNKQLVELALRHRPDAKVLLAGWDFFFSWTPQEVRELIPHLDPETTILWDYEADTVTDNNFTNWDVVGKFPYTFSMFLCYEMALDMRANYPLIEKRLAVAKSDPMCKGFLLWPESSHTDTLALSYFTANAWRPDGMPIEERVADFCRARYGRNAEKMEGIWNDVLPISYERSWWGNAGIEMMCNPSPEKPVSLEVLAKATSIFKRLGDLDLSEPTLRRDALDLARTVVDRALCSDEWKHDAEFWRLFADLLEQHEDYSVNDSYDLLEKDGKMANPDFQRVLLDNCSCGYCRSHQYEVVRYFFLPYAERGEYTREVSEELHRKFLETPLEAMRAMTPRTPENLKAVFGRLAMKMSPIKGKSNGQDA